MKRPSSDVDLHAKTKRAKGTVDSLVRGQADDFVLLLTKIKMEQLGGAPIVGTRQCFSILLVVAHRTETLPQLFQTLISNNILSVPVLNQSGKYFGFVDHRDIVSYVCDLFSDLTKTELDVEKLFDSVCFVSPLLIGIRRRSSLQQQCKI